MTEVTTIGVDLAKTVFQIHGVDCPYQKLNPDIGMMQSTKFGHGRDGAAVMNGPPQWRIFV